MISNPEKYSINPKWATLFNGAEVYRILRYKQRNFPQGYNTFDSSGILKKTGDKAVETFLRDKKYVASYQESLWESDGGYYKPEHTSLKIPTGTLYCYEVVAIRKKNYD